MEQYPFISDILAKDLDPWDGVGGISYDRLTIKVEKADGLLLFRRGRNVGLGIDKRYLINKKKGFGKRVMQRGEYLFAVGDGIINSLTWPRDYRERRNCGDPLAREIFFGREKENDAIFDSVKYLVWLTVESSYEPAKSNGSSESRFGTFHERVLSMTVYLPPDIGFKRLYQDSSYEDNLHLNDLVIAEAFANKDPDVLMLYGRLTELCQLLQDEVYHKGLKDLIDGAQANYLYNHFGTVKMDYCSMNKSKTLVIDDTSSWIILGISEDGQNLTLKSLEGMVPDIRNMFKAIIDVWSKDEQARILLQE